MANVKISQLPVVSSVTNSDVLPVVASATTSQLSIANLADSLPQVSSSISASFAISASWAPGGSDIDTGSFATTGSNNFTGDQHIATNLYVTGSSTFAGIAVRPVTATYGGLSTLIDSTNGVIQFGKADQSSEFTIEISGSSLYGNNWPQNLIASSPGLTILTSAGKTVDIGTALTVTGSTTISNGSLRIKEDATDVGGGFLVSAAGDYVTFGQQNSSAEFSIALSGSGLFPFGFQPTVTRLYSTKGFQIVTNAGQTTEISSSVLISGSLTADNFTGSLQGTASFAVSSSWAPTVISTSGSTIYSTSPATTGFDTTHGIFLGLSAGGNSEGSDYLIALGNSAGVFSSNADYSNFIGFQAGRQSTNASDSNFLGNRAGYAATSASGSNFIGRLAGYGALNANTSTFIGYQAGSMNGIGTNGPGSNNIIIGTNIVLEDDRKDSINIGGIIFATGSYSNSTGNAFSGSMTDAKVGINKSLPEYPLDISGSLRVDDGFTILTKVSESLDFVDDAAAASGGVPLGGLYRSGSIIVIRLA